MARKRGDVRIALEDQGAAPALGEIVQLELLDELLVGHVRKNLTTARFRVDHSHARNHMRIVVLEHWQLDALLVLFCRKSVPHRCSGRGVIEARLKDALARVR